MSDNEPQPSIATCLVDLAIKECKSFWHDELRNGYADIQFNGHLGTVRIRSSEFRYLLGRAFFSDTGRVAGNHAIVEAIETLEGRAIFQGSCFKRNVRIGHANKRIFLDLGNDAWEIVEIHSNGWSICKYSNCPVKFVRPKSLLPLPKPCRHGDLSTLRKVINVSQEDWVFVVAFLLSIFQPQGTFPILFVNGEQGSAKSTTCRLLRQLVDNNNCPIRAKARDEEALLITALNSAIVALDNLSNIDDGFSDSLCRLASGAGISKRTLYSDSDETILNVKRPVLINGIPELANRGDLLSRSLSLNLSPILETKRMTEAQINVEFDTLHSSCLGGLLNAVAVAVREHEQIKVRKLPRLADFYKWIVSAEQEAGLKQGEFESAYWKRLKSINRLAIDNSIVGSILVDFTKKLDGPWSGNCQLLLQELNDFLAPNIRDQYLRGKEWPKTPRSLSGHLKRLSPDLRRLGVSIKFDVDGRRTLEIQKI